LHGDGEVCPGEERVPDSEVEFGLEVFWWMLDFVEEEGVCDGPGIANVAVGADMV